MTDATTPEQPRTAAGRALLAAIQGEPKPSTRLRMILAIEAQARPAGASEPFTHRPEDAGEYPPLRPAVASEGLRAALAAFVEHHVPEAYADSADCYAVQEQAHAALKATDG